MYKMLVKDTTTGQCGLADVPCAPEALTPLAPININGSVISLDMLAVAAALGFTDCDGNPVLTGAVLATCADIADAIAALPADKYLQGLQSYDAATNTLTLLMNDGTTVAVPMTALLADAWADVTPAQVATKLGLLTCGGAAIPAGTQIATCADLNAAIAAIPSFTGAAVNAPLTGNGTAGSPLDINFAAMSPADIAALLTALNWRTCAGVVHTPNSTIPSCAEMNAAIAAAIAALPGDKYLQGLQSYDAASNTLTLLMNDGSFVPVDLTGLINDAVASVVVVSADAGNLITTGTDGGALMTTVPSTVVVAGDNIAVTGTGSAANPYVVAYDPDCTISEFRELNVGAANAPTIAAGSVLPVGSISVALAPFVIANPSTTCALHVTLSADVSFSQSCVGQQSGSQQVTGLLDIGAGPVVVASTIPQNGTSAILLTPNSIQRGALNAVIPPSGSLTVTPSLILTTNIAPFSLSASYGTQYGIFPRSNQVLLPV